MKTETFQKYQCEICGTYYGSSEEALKCESKSITQEKGVRIGDLVMITKGDGVGSLCKVDNVGIVSKDWGHYLWEKYWHTVVVSGEVIDGFSSRLLTFDSYEVVEK